MKFDSSEGIICPHCEYIHEDYHEYIYDNGFTHKMNCENCGTDFEYSVDFSFTFNSGKIGEE